MPGLHIARYTEPFASLVAPLAYEEEGGPELAYWFERERRSQRHWRLLHRTFERRLKFGAGAALLFSFFGRKRNQSKAAAEGISNAGNHPGGFGYFTGGDGCHASGRRCGRAVPRKHPGKHVQTYGRAAQGRRCASREFDQRD